MLRNRSSGSFKARVPFDSTSRKHGGGTGRQTLAFGTNNDFAYAVTLQPDGKTLVAGTTVASPGQPSPFAISRLNPDGSLDTSFNGTGTQLIQVGFGAVSVSDIGVQADGRIVLGGNAFMGGSVNHDDLLARLHADGTFDASFNGTGTSVVPVGASNEFGSDLLLQTDGAMLLVGLSLTLPSGAQSISVVRVLSSGVLDTSFSANGTLTVNVPGADSAYATGAVLMRDGTVMISANTVVNGTLARVQPTAMVPPTRASASACRTAWRPRRLRGSRWMSRSSTTRRSATTRPWCSTTAPRTSHA
jgi:uncharacterized delta-60 repeat protein